MTIDGYTAVRAVEGSIDDAEFFDFVVNDVVCLCFAILSYDCTVIRTCSFQP